MRFEVDADTPSGYRLVTDQPTLPVGPVVGAAPNSTRGGVDVDGQPFVESWDDSASAWRLVQTVAAFSEVVETPDTGGGSGFTFTQDTQPVATAHGDTWHDTATGRSFVWVVDPDSAQWVQFAPGGGSSSTALAQSMANVTFALNWAFPASGTAMPFDPTTMRLVQPAGDFVIADAAGTITCQRAGVYLISWLCPTTVSVASGVTGGMRLNVYLNGSLVGQSSAQIVNPTSLPGLASVAGSTMVRVAAGGVIMARGSVPGGGTATVTFTSSFSVLRVAD